MQRLKRKIMMKIKTELIRINLKPVEREKKLP